MAIVTHPRIYSPPTPRVAAIDQIEAWLESPSLMLLKDMNGHWPQFGNIIETGRIVGAQVHDARRAALGHLREVKERWTAGRYLALNTNPSLPKPLSSSPYIIA